VFDCEAVPVSRHWDEQNETNRLFSAKLFPNIQIEIGITMASVLDFGAIGDGKTDDTDAIRHAFEDGDGEVEFPRGEYLITSPIVIKMETRGRTSIRGNGGVAKLIMAGKGPCFSLIGTHAKTADPGGFRPEEWQNERMPTIDGIEIEGRHPEADGILINGIMQPTLTRVLIRTVRTAVRITSRARNVIINGCHFYHNTGIGVHLDAVNLHQCIIADSHISYCRRGGIRIEDSEIRNLQITGNDIEYNNYRAFRKDYADAEDEVTAEILVDVQNGSVREGTIASNTIQATFSSNGSNIRFIGAGGDANHRAGMWTITGNLIGSQNNNIHLTSVWGVNMTGNYFYSGHHRNILIEGSRNCVISANTFGHNPDYNDKELATGIRIVDSENCNLNGNIIQDAQAGKHTVANAVELEREALVEIVRCQRMNLNGNQILDGTPIGLLLEDCEDSLISANSIIDHRDPKQMTTGVAFRGKGTGNMLTNCRIIGATENGIVFNNPTDAVIQGNVVTP